ncbi:hypothetical protein FNL37_1766 [Methylovorus glucosotrophus]|uniref:hypothetical protein n=1 Tax=Methylovorus glucosotrophus TaxID=266009 RepID=UPI0013317D81|nr:hypothetical protein [Methylovorus glucosotrophus]KAF0844322.1 hypothetical protein FNL37_1766 [Methylovorus glucosotrophus]
MRNVTITFDDGSTHQYNNVPDDITPEQIQGRASKEFSRGVTHIDGGKKAPARTFGDRAADFYKGQLDSAMNISQNLMTPINRVIDYVQGKEGGSFAKGNKAEFDKELNANRDTTSFKAGRLIGDIEATMPIGAGLGAATKALGLTKLGTAIQSGGMTLGSPGGSAIVNGLTRVAGGTINGAATAGAVNPDDAVKGGVIGGVLPVALKVAGVAGSTISKIPAAAKSLIEPFYEGGQDAIVGRALNGVTGGYADDAIRNLKAADGLIPGVNPTAAEVAQNPGLAALQRSAVANNPVATNEMALRQVANQDARLAALDGLIPDKQAAITARDTATKGLYEQAKASPVTITPELDALLQRPSMQSAIARAKQLANEAGQTFDLENMTGQGAQYLKMALDDIANASPMTGIGGNELRAVQGTRGAFVDELGKQLPEYLQANQQYAELSAPLNQADIIAEIANKSKDFRGNLTPAKTAAAISDKTAQRVTGRPTATLEKVLTPEQLKMLDNLKQSLLMKDYAETAGRGVGSNTVQNLAYSNMIERAGIPTGITKFAPAGIVGNIVSKAADVGYKKANAQLAEKLALSLLNPQTAADLMQAAAQKPSAQSEVVRSLLAGLGEATSRSAPVLAVSRD